MANDVRFRKPVTITRPGTMFLYTYLRFYGPSSTGLVELYAYDAWGNALFYPFTDANSIQSVSYSGQWNGAYYQDRILAMPWVWDSAAVSAQAVTFRCWLYSDTGTLLDYVTA
ncbi:MAG TPA: hypothetical protein VFX59_30370 [Polyangiales bacterium]|nr:hypothetical protein [Polyangiales bacterium]